MEKTTSPYIVSARKYRPTTFDTIVGQEHVTNTLKNAILTNQIAQAYLFFGPRGVGKTTCARVFAKTINCLHLKETGEACNECASCKAFNSNTAFNIFELDAASNNSVEDIRQLIDQVRYPPQIGKYKVYIIDEVHMLSTAAFNAFLKTLEEPPPYAKFILATTEKNKVLPTILSRCQVFNFNRIKTEDIAKYLEKIAAKENHLFESEAIRIIAQKADGGLRDACSIYDQMAAFTQGNITKAAVIETLHVLDYDYYFQLTDAFLNQEYPKVLLLLDKIINKGFDLQNLLVGLIDHIRYLLLAKDPQTLVVLDVSDSAKSAILEQSKRCNEKFLLNALSILNKADINFKSSRHQRLHLEIHLLQICNILSSISNSEKKNLIDSHDAHLNFEQHVQGISAYEKRQELSAKIIKTSEKSIPNDITVNITTSIKEIKALLSHQQENIPEKKKETSENKSVNSLPTETIQNKADNTAIPNDNLINVVKETTNTYQTEKKQDNNNKPIPEKSDTSSQSLTTVEKKYQALLSKNPLLEELKIKLNLEFK
ncbi:MAG: DNA polymerase III subunit gamma/tau [Bacteroidia bacterium]|nr:DNA polymerase III subunit gamma/tau [Bacteroidia bacterium]